MLPADSPFASPPAPGPHPATAELRAYAAGTLSAADEHRIEAHTLDCERCAELLDGFSMSDAATTDQALASLRTRLQTRVADDLAEPVLVPASRPLWPRLAAGVALLGAVGAGLWRWEHQPPASVTASAPRQPAAPIAAMPAAAAPTVSAKKPSVVPPAAASRPQSVAQTPMPAATRPVDYAAVRPRRRAAQRRMGSPIASPAASVAAVHDTEAAVANNASAIQTPPAAIDARILASRAVAQPPASELAPAAVADEPAAAPGVGVAAAPRPAASARKAADSVAASAGIAPGNAFSQIKNLENSALVRDKPMPAAIAIAPAPVTGTPAFRDYLRREAAEFEPEEGAKPLHGVVRLRFMVGADGKLSNLQVVRNMRADYDEEALRIVCEGPAWRPGIAGGRRAALPMEIIVSF